MKLNLRRTLGLSEHRGSTQSDPRPGNIPPPKAVLALLVSRD